MLKTIGKMLSSLARIELNSTPYSTNASASIGTVDYGNIEIQLQDNLGNWRTFNVTRNIPAMIIAGMQQLSYQNPGKRIRAVTTSGQIVDIL